jgi:hypothetical protein
MRRALIVLAASLYPAPGTYHEDNRDSGTIDMTHAD